MNPSSKNKKRPSGRGADESPVNLDQLSLDELRAYLRERESREGGQTHGEPGKTLSATGSSAIRPTIAQAAGAFSVRETLRGKKVMVIGGTGFLGRVMLYMILKYVPDIERLYLLIRPTHGRTGYDRLHHEILESPVFTEVVGDAEFFKGAAKEKITVVEGDAARAGLNLNEADTKTLCEEVDIILNTAGNVEFNPPLDLSLNANAIATKEVLDFCEKTLCKKYVHISTCYVADRALHQDRAPEEIVLDRVRSGSGVEIRIDADRELKDSLAAVARLKQEFDDPSKTRDYIEQARTDLRRIGRDESELSDRLLERTAKNLRTMALREELIKEGKLRAERLNRPNVYTYTKTLAELLVKSREDRIKFTIVRPSIVETASRYPFPGWNEGIQGSAPLIYMTYRGHRMLPSLSDEPGERYEATLDIIPVDHVAAGTILAVCALLRDEAQPVYQLAAGPISTPITPNVLLNIVQHHVRHRKIEDEAGAVERWLRRNFQAYPVTKKTFRRFSSPRTLKVLSNVRDRIERFSRRHLPPRGADIVQRVQTTVERFYQMSYMKNRIFQEFLPFMNHGFPVFENQNGIDLWRRLPADESELFYFNPLALDYIDYMERLHMEAVFRWIFPVLDKRFKAITNIGRTTTERESDPDSGNLREALRTAFSSNDLEFRDRLHVLRRSARNRWKELRAQRKADPELALARTGAPTRFWLEAHLTQLAGDRVIKNLAQETDEALLEKISGHIEFVSGASMTPATLKELGTLPKIEKYLERWDEENTRERKRSVLELPEDGVEIPQWLRRPTGDMLYGLQMWFYRRIMQVKISGRDNIPLNNNRVIVVANHSSHLDYGLVWYTLGEYARDMGILAARDYFFDNFFKSTFFGNFLNLIPIERGDNTSYGKALKHAIKYLDKGGPLLIFPEGTRSSDGRIKPFRHGLGYLVQHTGADVLPLRLYNTHLALPKGKTVVRSTDVRVHIGKLVSYDTLERETQGFSPTKTYAHISKRLHDAVRDIHVE